MPTIDHIFIIHALEGYELHEDRLNKILPSFDIPFSFVTDGDPRYFTEELIGKYFHVDIQSILTTGVLSCTLNHILAYEKMLENEYEYCLVLENDPFFVSGFRPKVDRIIEEASKLDSGVIISLENTTMKFPPRKQLEKNRLLYPAEQGRAAGAYIVDKQAAKKMLQDLQNNPCKTVIDWWHNNMIAREVVKMYWAHPTLTEQGSHNGKLHAGISSKSASIFRQIAWKLHKFYKSQVLHRFR